MTARAFTPRMGRARPRRELPGWVLITVGVALVAATGAVEKATPGAMASFFHTVGLVAWWALIAIAVAAAIGLWVGIYVHCWRQMDGPTKDTP